MEVILKIKLCISISLKSVITDVILFPEEISLIGQGFIQFLNCHTPRKEHIFYKNLLIMTVIASSIDSFED